MRAKLLLIFAVLAFGRFLTGSASAAQRCILAELFASTT